VVAAAVEKIMMMGCWLVRRLGVVFRVGESAVQRADRSGQGEVENYREEHGC